MISTISKAYLDQITPKPQIHKLEEIDLDIKCADGLTLPYLGYIEVSVELPCTDQGPMFVPLLVVPTTEYNRTVPLIVGTNVIRQFKDYSSNSKEVPEAWQSAISSISNSQVGRVKSTTKLTLQPMEVKTVTGFVRKSENVESAITEPLENGNMTKVTVCPKIVSLNNRGTTARVPVRIFNMSAKVVTLPSKSDLCHLSEVKVLRSPSFAKRESIKTETVHLNQQTVNEEELFDSKGIQLDDSILTPEQKERVRHFLAKWQDVFSKSPTDLGCTNLVEHEIHLDNEQPFKEPYRRIPPALIQEVREHLKEMLEIGAIRDSKSPFSSNVVIVRKKDGTIRFCIDYRKLNQRTVKDAYAIPRIDDTLHLLAGAKYFSTLDLKSGYWQVELKEADKAKTAFQVGSLGFYECNRMPFGLCNAPATFQRLMERCMGELNLRDCLIYLDDIIIFSSTFEEHLERLQAVFERLQQHNLKLKPSKCVLFRRQVTYLGHVVSEEGIHTDPSKIEAVKSWPIPKTTKDVRRFLGFTGYYRRFIQGFAAIVRPLNDLLIGHATNPKARKKSTQKGIPFKWGTEQQQSFDSIIDKLTNPPVLAYADYSLPFIVHTDASFDGLGAVLYQHQADKDRVIAYASRSLKPSERNYPAHKLEFLALKWAVSEKFHDYLYGSTFEVITDNNPLTYVLTTAKLDATGQRWVASLCDYNFVIKYRCGKKNADADGLSRRQEDPSQNIIFPETLKALSHSMSIRVEKCPLMESLVVSDSPSQNLSDAHEVPDHLLQAHGLTYKDWRKAQLDDSSLRCIIPLIQEGSGVPAKRSLDPAVDTRYLKEWNKMFMSNGVLHRRVTFNDQDFIQLVLPPLFRDEVFHALHDDLGHQGRDRTLSLIKQRFFWPGMDTFIKEKVRMCGRCIRRKTGAVKSAEMVPITSSAPMEVVCLDYLSLEKSKGGFEDILVITDHFSRYAQAIPTRNQTAKTTARALFDNFIVHYGFPARIHSDQGQNFESKLIQELCRIARVEKSRTTPYHPMGNGQVERFNQTLLQMLGTLEDYQKSDWKAHVPTLVHAYNATFHDSTGYSPHYLMFGRHPRLAIDAFLGLPTESLSSPTQTEYVRKLKERLTFAYRKAQEQSKKAAARNKIKYDMNARNSILEPGDLVLVRNVGIRGKNKLADRWEHEPYLVLEQPNEDIPVYRVQRTDTRSKKTRLLHRNLLLPFMGLPRFEDEAVPLLHPHLEEDEQSNISPTRHSHRDSGIEKGTLSSELSLNSEGGSLSDDEQSLAQDRTDRYVIPMRRKSGEPGLLSRKLITSDHHSGSSEGSDSCSDEEDVATRPKRNCKPPKWMQSDDWVVGQLHTFVVDPDKVVFI